LDKYSKNYPDRKRKFTDITAVVSLLSIAAVRKTDLNPKEKA